MTLQAIQTSYKGCLFRSRLEARWAVFYDALGLRWDYEPEGYQLPSGWYLPDFYFPELRMWIEIKGKQPTDTELDLACDLADATDENVYIFGPIHMPDGKGPEGLLLIPCESMYWHSRWCVCESCGGFGLSIDGQTCPVRCTPDLPSGRPNARFVRAAYAAALSARFEHGETPNVTPRR